MSNSAFSKCISQKFPLSILPITENFAQDYNGVRAPLDLSLPPPTGRIVDNLYLDLTGIISACCHPKHKPAPPTEEHVMVAICEYIDHLFALIRPRNLLYIAVDGVVPRAVMRHRQFQHFQPGPPARPTEWIFSEVDQKSGMVDHNSTTQTEPILIAPGTPFMARLTNCLHYHAAKCISSEPAWQAIQVIISDSAVPGEARHKIMDFIRVQRASHSYKANTRHVLYSPDADLITLALITHEPHFAILREHFDGSRGTETQPNMSDGLIGGRMKSVDSGFCLVQIDILREYLQVELSGSEQPLDGDDLEATIDDWVFLYFLVNCAFLPVLPQLNLEADKLRVLFEVWQEIFAQRGTYLTYGCDIDLEFVQMIMCRLADSEQKNIDKIWGSAFVAPPIKCQAKKQAKRLRKENKCLKTAASKKNLTKISGQKETGMYLGMPSSTPPHPGGSQNDLDQQFVMQHRWTTFRQAYYSKVFGIKLHGRSGLRGRLTKAYIEGMLWLLNYYYKGCPSWSWFFPYDQPPLAADIKVATMKIKFPNGQPRKPFEQLMVVFPTGCLSCLPEAFANLMVDSRSPILEYYPTNARLVLSNNELRQKTVGLPPIFDEKRLLKAMAPSQLSLTNEEKWRNTLGEVYLMVGPRNRLHGAISGLHNSPQYKGQSRVAMKFLNEHFLVGFVKNRPVLLPGATLRSPYSAQMDIPDIVNNQSISTVFTLPDQPSGNVALLHLHPNVILPRPILGMCYHD
ncbi:5'-3' exoribonuclease 2 [Dimargaris cristalligena]|nr:5'-3' exoribonuclease 2 [Dimargaris cristalligena]